MQKFIFFFVQTSSFLCWIIQTKRLCMSCDQRLLTALSITLLSDICNRRLSCRLTYKVVFLVYVSPLWIGITSPQIDKFEQKCGWVRQKLAGRRSNCQKKIFDKYRSEINKFCLIFFYWPSLNYLSILEPFIKKHFARNWKTVESNRALPWLGNALAPVRLHFDCKNARTLSRNGHFLLFHHNS